MRRVPAWLTVALIVLALAGLTIGFWADTARYDWLAAHPLSSNIIAGMLAVPLTLLAALFLVDYFVERDAARRSDPRRILILSQIRSESVAAITKAGWGWVGRVRLGDHVGPEERVGWVTYLALLRVGVIGCRDGESAGLSATVPDGWTAWPPTLLDVPAVHEHQTKELVVAAAGHAVHVLDLLRELAELAGDEDISLFIRSTSQHFTLTQLLAQDFSLGELSDVELTTNPEPVEEGGSRHEERAGERAKPSRWTVEGTNAYDWMSLEDHLGHMGDNLAALLIKLELVRPEEWPADAAGAPRYALPD